VARFRQNKEYGPRVVVDTKTGTPKFISVPTPDYIRTIKPTDERGLEELHRYLSVYGLDNPQTLRDFESQYLRRFGITPESERYKDALKDLGETYSDRVAVAEARRNAQVTETVAGLDGDMQKRCVYINDGPEPCDRCAELNGEEMTYAEFVAHGALPGDRCRGGDNCMCILQPIERDA
jgi:hypothetical protein